MSTKQEIIKQAYGNYYPQLERCLDENGWSNNWNHFISVESRIFQPEEIEKNGKCWRPKSLQGLEDNNGWIKIENEEDLPKVDGINCWIITENNKQIRQRWFNKFWNEYEGEGKVTHYQPIEQPKPPIY